mgnify:CR=1 FL=1
MVGVLQAQITWISVNSQDFDLRLYMRRAHHVTDQLGLTALFMLCDTRATSTKVTFNNVRRNNR